MSILDLIPIALLGGVLGLEVVSFPQAMVSRPLVAATLAGALIGEAASEFAATLGTGAAHEISQTLDVAVANAARDAEASGLAEQIGRAHV